jgi:6-phosphogluconolactonase
MGATGMSEWRRFTDRGALDRALAQHVCARLKDDIDAVGEASLAVSGGNTPRQLFRLLSNLALDWSRVTITLVDERQVSPDSTDSNERLVRENLLQNQAGSATFIGLHSDNADALPELARRVAAIPRPFSVVILGMGADGHTASWFPCASNLHTLLDPDNPAELASSDPVTAAHQRTTLTLAAVLRSREIIVHICGEEKAAVLTEATARRYPIAALLEQDRAPVSIWWAP